MRIFINENYGDIYDEAKKMYQNIMSQILTKNENVLKSEISSLSHIYRTFFYKLKNDDEYHKNLYIQKEYINLKDEISKIMLKYFNNIDVLKNLNEIYKSFNVIEKEYPVLKDMLKNKNNIIISVYPEIPKDINSTYIYGNFYIDRALSFNKYNITINIPFALYQEQDIFSFLRNKILFDNETLLTFIHEMTHAYDFHRSKGKALQTNQAQQHKKMKNKLNHLMDNDEYKELVENLYLKIPHEYWARFVEVLYEIDSSILYVSFDEIMTNFIKKSSFFQFDKLTPDDKKRIIARLSNIYRKKKKIRQWDLFLYYKDIDDISILLNKLKYQKTPDGVYKFFKYILNNFNELSLEQINKIRQYSIDLSKQLNQ